jgi:hypothetical protein
VGFAHRDHDSFGGTLLGVLQTKTGNNVLSVWSAFCSPWLFIADSRRQLGESALQRATSKRRRLCCGRSKPHGPFCVRISRATFEIIFLLSGRPHDTTTDGFVYASLKGHNFSRQKALSAGCRRATYESNDETSDEGRIREAISDTVSRQSVFRPSENLASNQKGLR